MWCRVPILLPLRGNSAGRSFTSKDGKLFQVFGFKGEDTAGAPAEITPAYGDTFTLSQKWMDLDSSGNVTQVVYEDGDTLTFTNSPFVWEQVYAPAGEYLVGVPGQ